MEKKTANNSAAPQNQITPQLKKSKSSNKTAEEITLKKIDILHNQILACQQESVTYNNTFISSSIMCTILTASAGLISISSSNPLPIGVMYALYAIPMVYLLVFYNLLKYTGFQILLSDYRFVLEEQLNDLIRDKLLYWALGISKTRSFVFINGTSQAVFYLPPLVLFAHIILKFPSKDKMWCFFFIVYILEGVVCILQGWDLHKKLKNKKVNSRFYLIKDDSNEKRYHKVFPLLLEYQLADIPGVMSVTVKKRKKSSGKALVAYVVPDQEIDFSQLKQDIEDYCNLNLQPYERPYIEEANL